MEERDYWLSLSLVPQIGPKRFAQLLSFFKSAQAAWYASRQELKEAGLTENLIDQFISSKNSLNLKDYKQQLKNSRVSTLCLFEDEYPLNLKKISFPPPVLFMKGSFEAVSWNKTIGVVGTRKMTSYGKEVTETLGSTLVSYGFTIVSGLALGVDATAHKTAIENKGKTIAVLGC